MILGIREDRDNQLDRAAAMPHRKTAGIDPLDARLESTVGRLFLNGLISESQYDAGLKYGRIILDYLESIEAPQPYGNVDSSRAIEDDKCFKRKLSACQAREIIKRAAQWHSLRVTSVIAVVDDLAVYGIAPDLNDPRAWRRLRVGLSALAGDGFK